MKHLTTAMILGIILIGSLASIAAINAGFSSGVPDLEGKTVMVISTATASLPPTENVTLGVVGEREFIVVPFKRDDDSSFDVWVPLERISSLLVFDNMEEAVKYGNKRSLRRRFPPGSDGATKDVTGLVTLDGMPLADAVVEFTPLAGGRPTTGETNNDGRYELANGAIPGEYNVRIVHAYVPARYTGMGKLKAIVSDKRNEFNFELVSGR